MPETLVKVTLPEMGESVTEGSIVEWRVKPGQWIDAGATLVDVTTDKVDVEVPAPAAGVVTSLAAEEGATVARRRDTGRDRHLGRQARGRACRLGRAGNHRPRNRRPIDRDRGG